VEADQIDILAAAVLGDLEEIDDPVETRLSGQLWCDIRETNRHDRIHLNRTLFHAIADAYRHAGTHPDSHAARNVSATNALAQAPGEEHDCQSARQVLADKSLRRSRYRS